jgi:hypothetical protein
MEVAEQQRLQQIMAGMAGNDGRMVSALVDEFGGRLKSTVRSIVFGFGRRDVLCGEREVHDLVLTAALAIQARANGWDPEGAPPWIWAEKAVRSAIAAHIGHATVDLDPDLLAAGPPAQPELPFDGTAGLEGDAEAVLTRLAAIDDRASLWWHAVAQVTNDRNRTVYFEYEIQRALGDRSPSHTVAAQQGLTPDNVRQIASRVRRRLNALIAGDDRYAELRQLDWFAA